MPEHKVRYTLPLLTMMTSAVCVDAAEPSEKTANTVKPGQEKNLCPESVDQMGEDCLGITLLKLENKLDMRYKGLFQRAATKDSRLHGLSKQRFINARSGWKTYKEELCSDPIITADLKAPSDKILYLYDVQRTQHHLKALERF